MLPPDFYHFNFPACNINNTLFNGSLNVYWSKFLRQKRIYKNWLEGMGGQKIDPSGPELIWQLNIK